MKTIITGASGFVGQNLTAYLQQQQIAIHNLSLRNVSWQKNLDTQADAIIHLAGKAHDTANTSLAEEYFRINRDLTISLFDEFLVSNLSDFFFFSSVKAVADTVEKVLHENSTPLPKTPYGQSKLAAEQYILSKALPEGKRVFIIRPCMIHGPGNKGNLSLLYKIVEKGIPWPLGAFDNQRSFLSIDNLSFLIHQMLLKEDLPSGIYNFADDTPLSTNELITIISEELQLRPRLWKVNPSLIKGVARAGDFLSLPLNSERLKKLTESYVVANGKIKNSLGIEKLPLSAEEGLRLTIKSFKEND